LEQVTIVLTKAIRCDVLRQLGENGVLIDLIDLDDLFDLSLIEIASKQVGNLLGSAHSSSSSSSASTSYGRSESASSSSAAARAVPSRSCSQSPGKNSRSTRCASASDRSSLHRVVTRSGQKSMAMWAQSYLLPSRSCQNASSSLTDFPPCFFLRGHGINA